MAVLLVMRLPPSVQRSSRTAWLFGPGRFSVQKRSNGKWRTAILRGSARRNWHLANKADPGRRVTCAKVDSGPLLSCPPFDFIASLAYHTPAIFCQAKLSFMNMSDMMKYLPVTRVDQTWQERDTNINRGCEPLLLLHTSYECCCRVATIWSQIGRGVCLSLQRYR